MDPKKIEHVRGRRWFQSLTTSEKWELGDQLVLGCFDMLDWNFEKKPSSAFLRGADEARMDWEVEEDE